MEKKFYSPESLKRSLRSYEVRYGRSSEEVFDFSSRGERLEGLPARTRHMWMSLYVELCELGKRDEFAQSVEQTFATA